VNYMKAQWLIVTALGLEYKEVRSHLSALQSIVHAKGTQYEVGKFRLDDGEISVALVECGSGNVSAAIEVERGIAAFTPEGILFVGVAGGIKDVRIGDVVCASKVYAYESGKAVATFLPRPQSFQSAYPFVQAALSLARREISDVDGLESPSTPRVVVGPIAAGEKVVAALESAEYRFIRQQYSDAVAVEMEGYGFLHGGYANTANCMVIRGISDLVAEKTEADASGSQPRAARAAATVAFEIISILMHRAPVSDIDWKDLEHIAEELYPLGPLDNQIWDRSGGDVSMLQTWMSGRASWHQALRILRNGGGGNALSPRTLLDQMLRDHPKNVELSSLAIRLTGF